MFFCFGPLSGTRRHRETHFLVVKLSLPFPIVSLRQPLLRSNAREKHEFTPRIERNKVRHVYFTDLGLFRVRFRIISDYFAWCAHNREELAVNLLRLG